LDEGRNVFASVVSEGKTFAGHVDEGKNLDLKNLEFHIAAETLRQGLNDQPADAFFHRLRTEIDVPDNKHKQKNERTREDEPPFLKGNVREWRHVKSLAEKTLRALSGNRKNGIERGLKCYFPRKIQMAEKSLPIDFRNPGSGYGSSALKDANQNDDDGQNQQNMDETSQGVGGYETQQPEDQKHNAEGHKQVHVSISLNFESQQTSPAKFNPLER